MKLKVVNLGCKRCYKKIKKLLFKFPEKYETRLSLRRKTR
ncbi:unnamed protein product, partial [Vitis vinifera]